MKTWRNSTVILLKLIYITLFPVLEAQEITVRPEVTGYLGHDVTLPCQFIPASQDANITQVQWELTLPGGEEILIVVSNVQYGVSLRESFLEERVEIEEQSLIIRNVEMRDAGLYTCTIAAFPAGTFKGTTNLVVEEQMPLSSWVVFAIVIAVMLLLAIMAAMAYLIFIRGRDSTVRHRVYVDTDGPVMDVARPSVIVRDEEVVYSDVKLKPPRDATPSSNKNHKEDDVTYSEVLVLRHQPV